jgi:hypothetical protein
MEMAREYHETHDPEIPEEIYRLARLLYLRYRLCKQSYLFIQLWLYFFTVIVTG